MATFISFYFLKEEYFALMDFWKPSLVCVQYLDCCKNQPTKGANFNLCFAGQEQIIHN